MVAGPKIPDPKIRSRCDGALGFSFRLGGNILIVWLGPKQFLIRLLHLISIAGEVGGIGVTIPPTTTLSSKHILLDCPCDG